MLLTGLIPVKDSHDSPRISGWVSGGIVILAGGWIMNELAGLLLATLWAIGLAANLFHLEKLLRTAFLRIGWAILSAFIVAFLGSIAGEDPDKLLMANSDSAVTWGLLYFAGLAVERIWAGAKTLCQGEAD